MSRDSVAVWLNEIAAAKKREKDFRKEGDKILEIYGGKKKDSVPFNILFSNTETLLPAVYSATPRPVVSRRYKDNDLLGKAAAQAGQRALVFMLDTNVEGYETFDEAMRSATLDALLPGRGLTTVKYDAELEDLPTESVDEEEPVPPKEPQQYKKSELACCESRSWNRYYFGYAKKWSKVPWIAYEEDIDREEATRLFGAVLANSLKYSAERDEDNDKTEEEKSKGETKTTRIYQIWDRAGGRKIRYVSEHRKDGYLKVEDDPLGLTGFFNCPRPLQFIEKSNDLGPVAPYVLYENQAEELNKLTVRINRILSAIRAKGVYDSALGDDIKNLIEADDNTFEPADKNASIAAEGGLQNAIWWWPVDKLILVLRELLASREAVKATIFEIMGLADIMRGASQASETLGAQEIKQAWGGLRLKRTQKEVQRYARDVLRLLLEIAATKFSEETWARMTGLPFLTEKQFMEAQKILAAATQAAQMGDQAAMKAAQEAQQTLQQPKWADILSLLRDDITRSYRIDIETNSTVEPEAVEDQKNIAEVMTALGQFLNGVAPLVQTGVMPFQAAQAMMLAIVRRFRFGDEIEDYILQMQPPKPQDDGKAQKAEMEAAQKVQQAEAAVKAAQVEKDQIKRSADLDVRELTLKTERQLFDIEKKSAQESLAMKEQHSSQMLAQKTDHENQKLAMKKQVSALENQKFKTENVVNQKADATISTGIKQLEGIVTKLAEMQGTTLQALNALAAQNAESTAAIVKAVTGKRKSTMRGNNGRVYEVESEAA